MREESLLAPWDSTKGGNFFLPYIIGESDKEEHSALLDFIALWRKQDDTITLEDLIQLFEYVISPSDRIVNGAIYTPRNIREYIVQ